MKTFVLNGPNLGRLGTREPEIYGSMTYQQLAELCVNWGKELGLEVEVRQSDSQAELIGWISEANALRSPVVINPAAFTHYSLDLAEACKQHSEMIIEVHISNPHAREDFRKRSVISPVVNGTIAGFGADSYRLALMQVAKTLKK
jgi:3-dehydroquinate dehydratase-2